MSDTLPRASVVVPAYNAERTIGALLDSLLGLDYPKYEVIVVNDGSTDRTAEVAGRYPVKVIDQPNRGASAARAAGLLEAGCDVVAYADSDVQVTRNWLRKLVEPFRDPQVGATTGCTVFQRNDTCTSWMRSLDIERRNARRKRDTHLANGPNCAFRRDLLLEVGGFEPHWYHAEDTEVSYRLWRKGYRIRYVPEALVYHVPEDDWRSFLRKRFRDAKAFTRVLFRYPRAAVLQDDFVPVGMKIQPPLFLAALLLAVMAIPLLLTPFGLYVLALSAALIGLGTLLNVPEAVGVARASHRVAYFFQGIGLCLLRGTAWGLGLGIGGLKHITRS